MNGSFPIAWLILFLVSLNLNLFHFSFIILIKSEILNKVGVNAWSLFTELNFQPATDYEKKNNEAEKQSIEENWKIIYVI